MFKVEVFINLKKNSAKGGVMPEEEFTIDVYYCKLNTQIDNSPTCHQLRGNLILVLKSRPRMSPARVIL